MSYDEDVLLNFDVDVDAKPQWRAAPSGPYLCELVRHKPQKWDKGRAEELTWRPLEATGSQDMNLVNLDKTIFYDTFYFSENAREYNTKMLLRIKPDLKGQKSVKLVDLMDQLDGSVAILKVRCRMPGEDGNTGKWPRWEVEDYQTA